MASAKDTFESHAFRANSFASGTWRGVGVTVVSTARASSYPRIHGTDGRFGVVRGTESGFKAVGGADGRFEEVR